MGTDKNQYVSQNEDLCQICISLHFLYHTKEMNVYLILTSFVTYIVINPLNPELYPICYMLALLGAHHFLHVSRIRVKLLTFRLLMS